MISKNIPHSADSSYQFDIQPYETWSERAAGNFVDQLENRDLARLLIKIGMSDATLREKRVFVAYIFNDETFEEIAVARRVKMTHLNV